MAVSVLVPAWLLTLASCGSSGPPVAPATPRPLEVASVQELGTVGKPRTVTARDGGATALVGNRLLWAFGDTLFNPRSVDGTNLRCATAALADPVHPLATSEPLDANGAPYAFLPFTAEEEAYNASSGRPDQRIALWPGSVIPDGAGNGLVFYLKLVVNPGLLNYDFVGTGLARVAAGTTTAIRDPDLLFNHPQPMFDQATVQGSTVYLYGLLAGSQRVGVARAPLAQVADRSAYRFWDGTQWSTDPGTTHGLFGGVPGGVSVSYNAHLGRYLAIHSELLSNRVVMRTADRLEGPWSDPQPAFVGQTPASGVAYAGREHPELAAEAGRRIYISYYRPAGAFSGELRLVEVTLR